MFVCLKSIRVLRKSLLLISSMAVIVFLSLSPIILQAEIISVSGDDGKMLTLKNPAKRVIALGPNLVESLFEIGAGDYLIAVSEYSDYPEQAKHIRRVGSHNTVNYEMIVSMAPDLVLIWHSGFGRDVVDKLRALGLKVFVSEPQTLQDVDVLLQKLGELTGLNQQAQIASASYRKELKRLQSTYSAKTVVPVFYQVWHEPMQSLNGNHVVSAVIELCGGRNVFAQAKEIAPRVSIESVIAMNPQVIIASGSDGKRPSWLDDWLRWPMIDAVKQQQLYFVKPDVLVRHAPRILQGADQVCRLLEQARLGSSVSVDVSNSFGSSESIIKPGSIGNK